MKKLMALGLSLLSFSSIASVVMLTCPAPEQLSKDPKTQVWFYGKNLKAADFKSYDLSFAKKVKSFIGAQWQGVRVGTMTCIYQPDDKHIFSIILSFSHLVNEPNQGLWGQNQGGYRNCTALPNKPLTLADCAFAPMVKSSPTDIYQQLDDIKGSQ